MRAVIVAGLNNRREKNVGVHRDETVPGGEQSMGQLEGKVAIVTGATSGIGEQIAVRFVEEGARVVGAGRREAEGRKLEERCGDAVSFIRTDVSIESDVQAMIDHTKTQFGRLDCLVNNAGFGSPMVSITEVMGSDITSVFDTNVGGTIYGMKYAIPVMIAQGAGSIINIGSVAGLRGGLSGHIYSASKAAVVLLSKSVAAEVSGKGVRVNSISPGGIVTGIFAKAAGLEGAKADEVLDDISGLFADLQAVPRPGVTDDIANAAIFLASDAASFITGQDLAVDGGLVPFGKLGWEESVDFRANIARRVQAHGGADD
jgi:NAD(P)-dependent dehydrogenase (short-subunit alcohol dehydrogenase family)